MNWSEYVPHYLDYCRTHKKPRTVKNFDLPAVNSFHFDGALGDVTALHIESWAKGLRDSGYNRSTIAIFWASLSAAFGRAVKMKLLAVNPFLGIKKPRGEKPGRYLTLPEREMMLKSAPEPLRTMMVFGLNTGMRIGEAHSLRWEDVRDGIAYVPAPRRKNGKGLAMPLNSAALAVMGKGTSGRVFPYSIRTVQGQLMDLVKRLGIGRIRYQDFRHTFVTEFLKHGRESDLVRMGTHASQNGLKGYIHPPDELLRSRVEALVQKETPQPVIPRWWGSSTIQTYETLREEGLEPSNPFGRTHLKRIATDDFDELGNS